MRPLLSSATGFARGGIRVIEWLSKFYFLILAIILAVLLAFAASYAAVVSQNPLQVVEGQLTDYGPVA
ncbi:MAG: hypothetical protein HY658_07535 [Actinobacteria bacterium]|nr:hypothetical protein [Actinomycetota bacterium]